MKITSRKNFLLDKYLDCFETFDPSDMICKKYCSLNLRCAIESDQKDKMEIIDDMVAMDTAFLKFH